ncbi:hypothetical protein H6P81_020074 [Aristolochia fimbriata]|uniref:Uncharacterized protein n=1 Tax=Aristolochia fimbriata TaxID=158543 RepID=A0AAV7DTR7_ARIFI|nr:hypothetical protein H6P81_020074 [Aristolochia fimbriata]
MSFLPGRLASIEGAYFRQESKQAVEKLAQQLPPSTSRPVASELTETSEGDKSDVLPEVLRHSLPPAPLSPPADSSLSTDSRWVVVPPLNSSARVSPDAINPLRAFTSLPHVTFGPKRWQFPFVEDRSTLASTANELRHDIHSTVNSKKLEAAAKGLSQIGKAFVVATVIVFGGATVAFTVTASKLHLQSIDDIKTRGRALLEPQFEMARKQLDPLHVWAENMSRKWQVEWVKDAKEKPALVREITKVLGARPDK